MIHDMLKITHILAKLENSFSTNREESIILLDLMAHKPNITSK
jgi:hypothetical protein